MNLQRSVMVNGNRMDVVPARLMRARTLTVQRQLHAADWLLRRKEDGRFVACVSRTVRGTHWTWIDRCAAGREVVEAETLVRAAYLHARNSAAAPWHHRLPTDPVDTRRSDEFGSATDYADRTLLRIVAEPRFLAYAGTDRYDRPLWLTTSAAVAWRRMRVRAADDAVALQAISGFRSSAYQAGIFRRKLARGQSIGDILRVNAAPGFSEHHGGRAIDVGTPGEPPAEESFEHTAAFSWLTDNAARFGFVMSYPRDNRHGITYEPWHWAWHPRTPG